MQPIAFVTGADRGLGLALCGELLEQGWSVWAGQYMPDWPELKALMSQYADALHPVALDVDSTASVQSAAQAVGAAVGRLDLLINNAGVISPTLTRSIRKCQDYDEMQRLFGVNALGPIRVVEAFLPLMDQGTLKRLCFISSEAGSIERCRRQAWYGYCMSKSALNMAVRIMFNDLRLEGYTFRLYHPGWMRSYMSGQKNSQADMEPEEAAAKAVPFFLGTLADEDRLVMTDYAGHEWPW